MIFADFLGNLLYKAASRVFEVMFGDFLYWLKEDSCSAPSQKFHCPALISQLQLMNEHVSDGLDLNVVLWPVQYENESQ